MIHPIYLVVEFATNVTKPGHPLDGCLQPWTTLYWLVHNSDAYMQQGTNLDALDMHISNKKFSSLV
jgi:hypothetical protein